MSVNPNAMSRTRVPSFLEILRIRNHAKMAVMGKKIIRNNSSIIWCIAQILGQVASPKEEDRCILTPSQFELS